MRTLDQLLENNRRWAEQIKSQDPGFFQTLSQQQTPHYLWVGCSDSRVPANQIIGVYPGELFVHRNVANVVVHTDLNCLSVLQFAVDVLGVKHVIVCGHYGCAGVQAAQGTAPLGLVDNWLGNIRNVMRLHRTELEGIADPAARLRRLIDLNVLEQVYNLSQTPVVQKAWHSGAHLLLHGLVYELQDGLLQELALGIDSPEKAEAVAHASQRG